MLSVGNIVGGGLGMLRSRPIAVAVWALIYSGATIAYYLAVRAGLPVQQPATPETDPGVLAGMMGLGLLIMIVFLVFYMTLLTAAMRSAFRPDEPGLFYLRFGMDELRQIGLCLFLLILFYVGMIIVGIVMVVVAGLAVAATGTGVVMYVVIGIEVALFLAVAVWLNLRFTLAFPLTLLRGRFTITESWRLTRGRVWTLFGGFFLIWLILILLSVGAASVTLADYLADLARGGFGPEALRAAAQAQMARQMGPIEAMMVVGWILNGTAAAVGIAIYGGALATSALQLADVRAEMAETFA